MRFSLPMIALAAGIAIAGGYDAVLGCDSKPKERADSFDGGFERVRLAGEVAKLAEVRAGPVTYLAVVRGEGDGGGFVVPFGTICYEKPDVGLECHVPGVPE